MLWRTLEVVQLLVRKGADNYDEYIKYLERDYNICIKHLEVEDLQNISNLLRILKASKKE